MNMLIPLDDVRRWFEAADHNPTKATRLAVDEMRGRADAGDDEAAKVLDGWLHGGARQDLKSAFRARDQVLVIGPDLAIPRRFSIRHADGSRQLQTFAVMSLAEYDGVVEDYRHQTDRRVQVLAAFELVQQTWHAHPELATALDAFRASGIDLAQVVAEAV